MDENALPERIKALQEKYVALLTQAAQEGRTDDVASLNEKMQQEIQSLTNEVMQSALGGAEAARADTDEVGGFEDEVEDIEDSWEDDGEDEDEDEDDDWEDDDEED